jgi:hypothetical protein
MSTAKSSLVRINPVGLFSNGFLNYSRKKGASKLGNGEKLEFCCN